MKRWLVTVFVFLLLGAIVNVAVALVAERWARFGVTHDAMPVWLTDAQGNYAGRASSSFIASAGWPLRTFEGDGERYPLRPIWPGFAINTVFYAGVLWLLFAAPFALRRRWRFRRGLCQKCAYDLRGSGGGGSGGGGGAASHICPECGAAIGPLLQRG